MDGNPLPGVIVTLNQCDGVRETVSDAEGRYSFAEVGDDYSLSVAMDGLAVSTIRGTSIEMRLSRTNEAICVDCCDDSWDCHPDPAPTTSWVPRVTHLPIARGIAGALDLAPGVH